MTSELEEEGEETVTDGETEHTYSSQPHQNIPVHTLHQEQAVRVKAPTVPLMALVYGEIRLVTLLIFCMLSSWSQD